jgi:AAA15 family ATPase/GTPase
MKIKNLSIKNYKAIKNLQMKDLGQLVLIAGGNGVGKSCIFDAIRILKSSYGRYDQNEWNSFLAEFQLNNKKVQKNKTNLFRNLNEPIKIELEIELTKPEREFVTSEGMKRINQKIWAALTKQNSEPENSEAPPSEKERVFRSEYNRIIKEGNVEFEKEINKNLFKGAIVINPNDHEIKTTPNIVLDILFSLYKPESIGIIDYHGPNRTYRREEVRNLNMDNPNDNKKNYALYNSHAKYQNIKGEIATNYVKALISKESGNKDNQIESLGSTLEELFRIFFPTKKFLGIIPNNDGTLEFPVQVQEGLTHDINELSSGEKEILFGYLRLRNSTPKNSVILMDEPELHLNPLIAQKLPDFYYKTIGLECNNQIWLVTHSEAILRESFSNSNYSVYHLREATSKIHQQAKQLKIDSDIEAVLIDLIGDLTTYKPDNKILLLEGENSEFDKKLIQKLFPDYSKDLNIISAGSKKNVINLHATLEKAVEQGLIDSQFYSITDSGYLPNFEKFDLKGKSFKWNVYHIENYLLNPYYIKMVLKDVCFNKKSPTEKNIKSDLESIAKESIDLLTRQHISKYVDNILFNSRIKPKKNLDLSNSFHLLATEVRDYISDSLENELSQKNIKKQIDTSKLDLNNSFKNDEWLKTFKGREILKIYSSRKANLRYEQFRNLIISKMVFDNYRPSGIEEILRIIINE